MVSKENKMNPHIWLKMPRKQRDELAAQYGIVRRGTIEVVDNAVTSDGFTAEDLLKIPDGLYKLEDTGSSIPHHIGTTERDSDPADTRTQNTVITERTVQPEEILTAVVAPEDGMGTSVAVSEDKVVAQPVVSQPTPDETPVVVVPHETTEVKANISTNDKKQSSKIK